VELTYSKHARLQMLKRKITEEDVDWRCPGRPVTALVSRERRGSTGWRLVVGFCRYV
jgi:hypothetical protein